MKSLKQCVLVLACALFPVGCQSGGPKDAKTHIRFSGYAGNPAETDLMKKLVADFNASQAEIVAHYEPVPGQYYPKMLTMLVSKTAPDVFYLDILVFKPFLAKGVLRPLDDFLARSSTKREDFIPKLVDAFSDQGKTYGIPKDFNTLGLFYNKRMFDAAGLSYPDRSWSLDTFRQAAKKLTRSDKNQFGLAYPHDMVDRYMPVARTFGAELFGPDGHCAMGSPEALAAMDFYAGLKTKDRAAIYPSEVGSSWPGDAFGRQNAAMVFEGSWLIPYLKESFPQVNYGVTELPHGPKGKSNFLFTVSYVVPTTSKHPEAAWKLIEFLTSESAQDQVTFALPSRAAVSTRYAQSRPEYQPILAGSRYAAPFEFGPKGKAVYDRLGVSLQEVFLGAKPADQALKDAADEIDRLSKL